MDESANIFANECVNFADCNFELEKYRKMKRILNKGENTIDMAYRGVLYPNANNRSLRRIKVRIFGM